MADSIENRKATVEWLWSLQRDEMCGAKAHKDDLNNLKLYAEFSQLTIQSWEDLQRPIRLAKERVLQDVEEIEVKEEIDYDDNDAPPQGRAAVAALGVKAEDSGEGDAKVFDVGCAGANPCLNCQASPAAP